MNSSRHRGQILVKSFPDGVKVLQFKILRARGPGKFYSQRTTSPKVWDDDSLARENRSRSTGADRERFEPLSWRVSSESVCRDPARLSSGESDRRIGDGQRIGMYTLLGAGAC